MTFDHFDLTAHCYQASAIRWQLQVTQTHTRTLIVLQTHKTFSFSMVFTLLQFQRVPASQNIQAVDEKAFVLLSALTRIPDTCAI